MKRQQTLQRAKALRTNQTDAEQRLWYHLRAQRFMGLKFKRQKPVGSYIVDFVCMERQLIIELDGGQHAEQATYDQQRDTWLRCQGYSVLRFWNNEVMQQLEGVLEQVRLTCSSSVAVSQAQTPSLPASLPQAGERRQTEVVGREDERESGREEIAGKGKQAGKEEK